MDMTIYKNRQLSSLSADEILDEITFREFKKILRRARQAKTTGKPNVPKYKEEIYKALENMCVDKDSVLEDYEGLSIEAAVEKFISFDGKLEKLLRAIFLVYKNNDIPQEE